LENENRSPNFQVGTVGCWNARSIRLVRASNSALDIVGPRCDIQFSIDIVAALFVTSFASSHRSTQPATFGLAFMPNIRIYMATAVSFQTPPQEGSNGRRQSPGLPANLYTLSYTHLAVFRRSISTTRPRSPSTAIHSLLFAHRHHESGTFKG
jgi:hypothetical protein